MLKIGCHISSAKGYEYMGKEAVKIGADTLQFFTRNPRGGKAKEIDPEDVKKFLDMWGEKGYGKIVAHAPYTLNPCSANKKVRDFAAIAMADDMKRMEYTPGNYYNFHPGSHVGQGAEKGIEMIAGLLNDILDESQTTTVLLETMAGKGSEVGGTFEELAEIIKRVKLEDKVGVCMDTCHVSDGGYDIKNHLDDVLEEFDKVIGIKRLCVIHINDSMNPLGAHKDRHAKLDEGHIGMAAFERIINHALLRELPFILETPNDSEGYAEEIRQLKKLYKV